MPKFGGQFSLMSSLRSLGCLSFAPPPLILLFLLLCVSAVVRTSFHVDVGSLINLQYSASSYRLSETQL